MPIKSNTPNPARSLAERKGRSVFDDVPNGWVGYILALQPATDFDFQIKSSAGALRVMSLERVPWKALLPRQPQLMPSGQKRIRQLPPLTSASLLHRIRYRCQPKPSSGFKARSPATLLCVRAWEVGTAWL